MYAQIHEPVRFKSEFKRLSETEGEIIFKGSIEEGWHVYSTNLGDDGPVSASFNIDKIDGAELVGTLMPVGKEVSSYDKMFEMNIRYFNNEAEFKQIVTLKGVNYEIGRAHD